MVKVEVPHEDGLPNDILRVRREGFRCLRRCCQMYSMNLVGGGVKDFAVVVVSVTVDVKNVNNSSRDTSTTC